MEDLILRQATLKEQLAILKINHSSWGKQFPLPQYIEREGLLASLSFASTRICHVLISPTQPTKILASCESYTRTCELTTSGVKKSGSCWAIGSVFTASENRGRGYASRMMGLMYTKCKESGCISSTLYSDIGPVFYDRLGWKIHPSVSGIFDVKSWRDDVEGGLDPERIATHRVSDILHLKRDEPSGENSFSMPVTQEAIHWLFTRSTHYASVKNLLKPDTVGFKLDDDYILFYLDFNEMKMKVMASRITTGDNARVLIGACVREGSKWKGILEKIEIWDPVDCVREVGGVLVEERSESLSSLAVFESDNDVEWIGNEFIHWV